MHTGLRVRCSLFLSDFKHNLISSKRFERFSNFENHESKFRRSGAVSWEATNTETHDTVTSRFSQILRKRLKNCARRNMKPLILKLLVRVGVFKLTIRQIMKKLAAHSC